jgi:hypothetical protein
MSRLLSFTLLIFLASVAGLFAQTASLFTVEQSGLRSQRINLVFLSEGYQVADLPAFSNHVDTVVNYLFSRQPWQQYRSYCNIYRIETASNESGTDNGNSAPGGVRDTYFNSGFYTPSVPQLLSLDGTGSSRAFALLNQQVPEYDVVIMLVNDTKYGGSGGSLAVASINASSSMIVEHELGHTVAGLADEYDNEYLIFTPVEQHNTTQQTDPALVKWRHWFEPTTPIPTPEVPAHDAVVGLFEGANYRIHGWYRPHNSSLMKVLGRPVGEVNREQFVLNYYSQISPIDGHSPTHTNSSLSGNQMLNFSVTNKLPTSGVALLVSWKIDGVLQVNATNATFNVGTPFLSNGLHMVTATTQDPTAYVRNDPTGLLNDTVTWTLNLSNVTQGTDNTPEIAIIRSGGNVILYWLSAGTADFNLEQAANLAAPVGWTTSSASVIDDTTNRTAIIPAAAGSQFFRLRKP